MRWPELAGDGRNPIAQAQTQASCGASIVQNQKLEFWKRSFGERSYRSSERARCGDEGGMVVGGQGGVYGGGEGGEVGGENGLFGRKEEEEEGGGDGGMVVVVVEMKEEMEEVEVVLLVVKMEVEEVENGWPKEAPWLRFAAMLSVGCKWKRKKEKVKEREKEGWVCIYIKEGVYIYTYKKGMIII